MRPKRKTPGGFTLIEMMIALALMAMLMGAIAAAVHASLTNYRENEEMFRAISTARQAVVRITTDLRTSSAIKSDDGAEVCTISLDGDPEEDGSTAVWDIAYEFDDAANALNFVQYNTDGTILASNILCRNVTAMNFTRTPASGKARSVRISMTVTVGDHSQTVSSAAVIRRNL